MGREFGEIEYLDEMWDEEDGEEIVAAMNRNGADPRQFERSMQECY